MGPLYTIVSVNSERNWLTSAGRFSVTKINQILSFFVTLVWLFVFIRSIGPVSPSLRLDLFKVAVVVLTLAALICLWTWGNHVAGTVHRSSWCENSRLMRHLICYLKLIRLRRAVVMVIDIQYIDCTNLTSIRFRRKAH